MSVGDFFQIELDGRDYQTHCLPTGWGPAVIEIAVLLYLWATGLGCAGGIIDALRRWHRHQRALSRLITLGG